ncbi:MAG: PAS domain S-box protein [Desulfobacteraceae bacterium]|nr:PAS domain S-box protein [Desulfobacteraceae bacterium]
MTKKPTYEELIQRVKELENESLKHKWVEEALRESERRYRDLYENAPNAYFSVSALDGSILRCNSAAVRLLGHNKKTIVGIKVLDLYAETPHGLLIAKEVFNRFKEGESIRDVELQMKHKEGYPIWVSLSVEPVRAKDGTITESRSMVIDISDRKWLETALIQKEKLNTLGTIAAEVAHEIRNPLVSIGGFARRLQKKFKDLHEIDIILREVKRLEDLLARLRNYLSPVDIQLKKCSVNAIIKDCLGLLFPDTERKRVLCQLDLDSRQSVIYSDTDILTQIFINLIRNASEAMSEGGVLFIRTLEDNQNLYIEFKNRVSALKIKDPEILFMPFSEGGQSIGLPLSYRLLKNMGGNLSFTEEKDHVTFTVSLNKSIQLKPEEKKLQSG